MKAELEEREPSYFERLARRVATYILLAAVILSFASDSPPSPLQALIAFGLPALLVYVFWLFYRW